MKLFIEKAQGFVPAGDRTPVSETAETEGTVRGGGIGEPQSDRLFLFPGDSAESTGCTGIQHCRRDHGRHQAGSAAGNH